MRFFRIISVICFSVLFLPLLFVQAQEEKKLAQKSASTLIYEAEQQIRKRNKVKVEDRLAALEEISQVYQRLRDTANTLADFGLNDPDYQVRIKSAQTLAVMGPAAGNSADVVVALAGTLEKDEHPQVRIAAANALGAVLWEESNPGRAKFAVPGLVKAMKHDNDILVSRSACYTFRKMRRTAKDAAPHLLEVMKSTDDGPLRELACRSFYEVIAPDSTEIVPVLLEMIKKGIEDPNVETSVWVALRRIDHQDGTVVSFMIETLKRSKRVELHGAAASVLGKIGPKAKSAVPDLIAVLERAANEKQEVPVRVQNTVITALGQIGPEARSAIPTIRKLATNPKTADEVRITAKKVLELLNK
jgi:HEAT repeat protein